SRDGRPDLGEPTWPAAARVRFSATPRRLAHLGRARRGREASCMLSHPLRASLAALAAALVLPTAAASATTFCVGVPGCAGTPEFTLQDALTAAGGATASSSAS